MRARQFVFVLLLLAAAGPALAHLPPIRGKLVHLVASSDAILIGIVHRVGGKLSIEPQQIILPKGRNQFAQRITLENGPAFPSGSRQVLFLRHSARGWISVQPPGVLFPAAKADDALYRTVIRGIARSLMTNGSERTMILRSALAAGLAARAAPLRYHAALELSALRTGLSAASTLREAQPKASTDPALQPLLNGVFP